MTPGLLTLIDVHTSGGSIDETKTTNTVSILTYFSWSTILLLVTAGLTTGLNTDLSLETILVTVTHLGTQSLQTSLTLGTVCIDLTLEMTQTSLAGVGWRTFGIVGTT